jgi:tRNA(Glu) U13 pseudouridine synthase TruD
MLFQFKTHNEDFVVKEELWFKLSWKGDVFFVNFRKNNFNTMDIVEHLCYGLRLERKELWIAGLKDKNGITDQRVSIYKRVLNRIWWEEKFLEVLSQKTRILDTTRHDTPLAVWKNAGNYFKIKLIAKWNITDEIIEKIEKNLSHVQKNWFPNCFGKQRFGKGYRNFYRAKEIFESTDQKIDDKFEIRFKLQAYASMYFNEYTMKRRQKWQIFLWWDIMTSWNHAFDIKVWIYDKWKVWLFDYEKTKTEFEGENFIHPYYLSWETIDITKDPINHCGRRPTWPMLGFNMLMPQKDSKSYFRDQELLTETDYANKWINIAKKYNIYWFRRPLWAIPKNLKYEREQNPKDKYKKDLILSFSLPTGSYATTFLWVIFEWIDEKTIIENWLEIPLIKKG